MIHHALDARGIETGGIVVRDDAQGVSVLEHLDTEHVAALLANGVDVLGATAERPAIKEVLIGKTHLIQRTVERRAAQLANQRGIGNA